MICSRAGWSNDTYRRLGYDHYGGLFRCREVIHALQAGRAVDCLVELGRKKRQITMSVRVELRRSKSHPFSPDSLE